MQLSSIGEEIESSIFSSHGIVAS